MFVQLSADQIGQLYELFQATKEVFVSEEERLQREKEGQQENSDGIPKSEVLPDLSQKQ